MEEKSTKDKNIHAGHRDRLRKKASKSISSFEDHELLEMLLTYTIPRKNTNPIAHELINNFGNFANILDAPIFELKSVKGVGENTALFFNVLKNIVERYNASQTQKKKFYIKSPYDIVKYYRANFEIKNYEELLVIAINKNNLVVKTRIFDGLDQSTIEFNTKEFAQNFLGEDVKCVALVHTHPNGKCIPSLEDVDATRMLLNVCLTFNVDLMDHVILNEADHYSFKSSHKLDEIKQDILRFHKLTGLSRYEQLVKRYGNKDEQD